MPSSGSRSIRLSVLPGEYITVRSNQAFVQRCWDEKVPKSYRVKARQRSNPISRCRLKIESRRWQVDKPTRRRDGSRIWIGWMTAATLQPGVVMIPPGGAPNQDKTSFIKLRRGSPGNEKINPTRNGTLGSPRFTEASASMTQYCAFSISRTDQGTRTRCCSPMSWAPMRSLKQISQLVSPNGKGVICTGNGFSPSCRNPSR